MKTMPVPWSPYIGPPFTHAMTWPFAVMLGNERAASHKRRQRISWDTTYNEWRVEDQ